MPLATSIIEKKRARSTTEDVPHVRKKVASEIMAFEFESLSLSTSSGPLQRRHPPVGQQSVQGQHQPLDQVHEQRPQLQQQRGRAKTTSAGSVYVGTQDTLEARQGHGDVPGPSPMLPVPVTGLEVSSNPMSIHTQQNILESISPHSLSSPLSPSNPQPTSITSTSMDMSMNTDDGAVETSRRLATNSAETSSEVANSVSQIAPNVRVLNLRQRKWNSVSKEWQEWQDVQATHTPDVSAPSGYPVQSMDECTVLTADDTRTKTASGIGATTSAAYSSVSPLVSPPRARNGKETASENTSTESAQTNGLGRQRSFRETRGKSTAEYGQEHSRDDQRHFGTRARSFSETNIYPYTQHQHQQQHDPHAPILSQVSHRFNQPSILQKLEPHQQQHDSHQLIGQQQQQQHHLRQTGHPPRQYHSDHVESYHDPWERNDDGELEYLHYNQPQQTLSLRPRLMQTSPGIAHNHHEHPWMALSMTSLDGSLNIPSDRYSRHSSGSSSMAAAASSSTSIHGYRQSETTSWNQQLFKSQNGYHENIGTSRHGFGRANSTQYQHSPALHHHGQEDVPMGDETMRLMPSRSSSPSPCLSMAPTISRPLSISFSQLAGSNLLGDLAEHEHDDDMEL
ncbi:hypothetical protein BGZ51_007561 [Haplosporangium sp. Z 767]|nr:hypothetical protein BGZ51_007561 [Haplosporangium sp. Z 767]KAF9191720.1 hypothetical protein BGZ50_009193 [Haplosporangium sp. Z 11]